MQIAKYVVLGLYLIVCIALIVLATIQTKENTRSICYYYRFNNKQFLRKE